MAEWISVKDGRKPINGECVLVIRRASLGSLAYGGKRQCRLIVIIAIR